MGRSRKVLIIGGLSGASLLLSLFTAAPLSARNNQPGGSMWVADDPVAAVDVLLKMRDLTAFESRSIPGQIVGMPGEDFKGNSKKKIKAKGVKTRTKLGKVIDNPDSNEKKIEPKLYAKVDDKSSKVAKNVFPNIKLKPAKDGSGKLKIKPGKKTSLFAKDDGELEPVESSKLKGKKVQLAVADPAASKKIKLTAPDANKPLKSKTKASKADLKELKKALDRVKDKGRSAKVRLTVPGAKPTTKGPVNKGMGKGRGKKSQRTAKTTFRIRIVDGVPADFRIRSVPSPSRVSVRR